jgi:uncharacterized protein involved in outer membrane biogenesis
MKALQWMLVVIGAVGVLVFVAIAVGPAWLNTFIHTDAFRHEVETRASESLGGKVEIGSIDFSIWSGIRLGGLVTRIDSSQMNGQGALVARVESVSCNYSLLQLLRRRLELTGLTLDQPQIILTRQPATQVAVPAPAANAAETGAPTTPTTPGGKAAPFQFYLEAAKIKDGSASVRDASGASLAELKGIQITADTSGYAEGKDVTGKVRIATIGLPSNVQVTDFSTPFTYRTGAASAQPFTATAFNGRLAGDYQLGPQAASLLDLNGKGIDVAQVGQAAQPSSPMKLTGSLDLQSKWRGVETGRIEGEGDAQLTNGKIGGVPLLRELGEALRVKELEEPTLRSVQTHFQVANGQTRLTGLQLDAGIFQMNGNGTILADGTLDADMVLILTRDAMGRIPKEVAMFFVQRQDGSASIAFHIGGTVNNPKTDLATRIFLQAAPVKNVISHALDRFFHKRSSTEQAPAPAPVDNPPTGAIPAGP